MSPPPRVFFVHVMKTGGVSFGSMLRAHVPGDSYPDPAAGDGPPVKLGIDRLLSLDPARRESVNFYSVHMPAWVAETVSSDFVKVTLVREPVERTVSHLRHIARMTGMPDDVEEIYADDGWRLRLRDLQTRLFADNADLHAARRRAAETVRDKMTPEGRRRALNLGWSTSAPGADMLDEADLARATERLETFDVVGTTDDLPGMARRLGERLGLDLPVPDHANKAPERQPLPDHLLEQVVADTRLDARFYARASELAAH